MCKTPCVTQPSPLYQLLEQKLGRPLTEVVAERRGTQTWLEIAQYLTAATDVRVTSETLRNWFRDRITIEVKVA